MNRTDLIAASTGKTASLVLVAVADHFTAVDPTADLDADTLTLAIGAEGYKACGRSTNGRTAELVASIATLVPELTVGVTRGEFALLLRRTVAVHERTSEDNEKVLPTIPGPRKAEQSTAPLCCGHATRRDGQHFVCRKCKAWVDPGAATTSVDAGTGAR